MRYLNTIDYVVFILYAIVLLGLGLYLSRRATKSIEDYYIAGRTLPWWALGISGMTYYFDLAGTTLLISFIFLLGPRGLFIEFRGGVALILPIMMLWTGKWHRRSGVMTGAEWMVFRFGEGFGGQFARVISAVAVVISTIGMLAYSIKAVSLFFAVFLPFSPFTCALIILGITTLYTMMSGFYGVVYSNLFQGIVILLGAAAVVVIAFLRVPDSASLAGLAAQVTGNADWITSFPQWSTALPAGYEMYQDLMMFTFFYLVKTLFQGMGWGDDPRYFGARSDRECGMLTFLWTSLMSFRWPLIMAVAVLGIFLVKELIPDQAVISQAAALIHQQVGAVDKTQWAALLSGIINSPQEYSAALVGGLQKILGPDWRNMLQMVSYEGTVNPERIMPAVVMYSIPDGVRGLLIVALLAAEMSTFSGSVNRAAGFLTRDIYQRYFRPVAGNRELILASWVSVLALVGCGFMFAYTVRSINDIWGWITMGLGSGLLVPAFLRFYWWRFNGGGFAIGTTAGLVAALLQRAFVPQLNEVQQFVTIGSVSLLAAITGTFLSQPTDPQLLTKFYRMTRPFGFWKGFKQTLSPAVRDAMEKEHRHDLAALPFGLLWQVTMYLLPMLLVIHEWTGFTVTLALFLLALGGLYFFWYRHLPSANFPSDPEPAAVVVSEISGEPEPIVS